MPRLNKNTKINIQKPPTPTHVVTYTPHPKRPVKCTDRQAKRCDARDRPGPSITLPKTQPQQAQHARGENSAPVETELVQARYGACTEEAGGFLGQYGVTCGILASMIFVLAYVGVDGGVGGTFGILCIDFPVYALSYGYIAWVGVAGMG